jgi:hypothetical protein
MKTLSETDWERFVEGDFQGFQGVELDMDACIDW